MQKIIMYIGANNCTGKVEIKKAIKVISKYYDGCNLQRMAGVGKGKQEKTLVASIVVDAVQDNVINSCCKELKVVLQQESIMVEVVDTNTKFM